MCMHFVKRDLIYLYISPLCIARYRTAISLFCGHGREINNTNDLNLGAVGVMFVQAVSLLFTLPSYLVT